jgi:enoyl-[acyl-carrier protein] reductase II
MRTRITESFGITHPIVLSGMSWISVPRLVAAVSNAGGLGILATGVLSPEQTRAAIGEVRALTDRPFGANATLYFPGAKENARVLLDEQVPVINFSMGKGDWIVEQAHAYGGKVVATVTTLKHACSAAEYGTDALLVTGHEAAGHGSDVSSLVLVPLIAREVGVPIIAAGGFADGPALCAALALGADAIAMGSRFMCTVESPVHAGCKQLAEDRGVHDTVYSRRFDGQPCRVLRSPGSDRAIRRGLDLTRALFNSRDIAAMVGAPWLVLASGWSNTRQLAHLANAFKAFKIATQQGDVDRGVLPLGQVTGLIHDTPTVAELVERIAVEAAEIHGRTARAFV